MAETAESTKNISSAETSAPIPKADDYGKKVDYFTRTDFFESVKAGTYPAFSEALKANPGSKVSISPEAVYSATTGRQYTGWTFLSIKDRLQRAGYASSREDGHIYVATPGQLLKDGCKVPDGIKKISVTSYDKDSNQLFYYKLIPVDTLPDQGQGLHRSDDFPAPAKNPEEKFEALDPDTTPEKFLGAYSAACKRGAQFITTPEVARSVQQQLVEREFVFKSADKVQKFGEFCNKSANSLISSLVATLDKEISQKKEKSRTHSHSESEMGIA